MHFASLLVIVAMTSGQLVPERVFPKKTTPGSLVEGEKSVRNTTIHYKRIEALESRGSTRERLNTSHVVYAPLDEHKKVYTADRVPARPYSNANGVVIHKSSERAPRRRSRPRSRPVSESKDTTAFPRGFRGQSFVAEIDPDQKRTTIAESAASRSTEPTTPLPQTLFSETAPKNGFIRINAHPSVGVNASKSFDEHIVSFDSRLGESLDPISNTATSDLEERRFPAKSWQIPPTLADQRAHKETKGKEKGYLLSGSISRPRPLVDSITGLRPDHAERIVSDDALPPLPRPYTPPLLGPDAVLAPIQAITSTLGSATGALLGGPAFNQFAYRPPPALPAPAAANRNYEDREVRPKFRATFAKHNDVMRPIPLPESPVIAEDDMDLLVVTTLAPLRPAAPLPGGPAGMVNRLNPVPIGTAPFGQPPVYQQPLGPNEKLVSCCTKQGLSPSCQSLCNFDTFSDKSLVSTFLTNQCPDPQRGLAFECANSRADHTECCIRNNVHLYNGGQCMPFCRTDIPTPPNVFTYLPCLQVFDTIKNCYREYQHTHPNIFGD